MTSRNWVKLFLTTLAIGGLTTALAGFIVRWSEFQPYFTEFKIGDILSTTIWLIVMGFLFSVVSQMGFFAYLTVHRFGLGIFRSTFLWNGVQIILILVVLFDFVYLKYLTVGLALFILLMGLAVAYFKQKQTNQLAFIPALFFMVVATIVEWSPALQVHKKSWIYLMMFSLLACNAYQILILHKLNARSEEERKKLRTNGSKNNKVNKKPSIKA